MSSMCSPVIDRARSCGRDAQRARAAVSERSLFEAVRLLAVVLENPPAMRATE